MSLDCALTNKPRKLRWRRRALGAAVVGMSLLLAGLIGRRLAADHQYRRALQALGHYDALTARACLQRYLDVLPHNLAGHLAAARAARLDGDFSAAQRHLQECERLRDKDTERLALEEHLVDAQRGALGPEGARFLLSWAERGPDAAREAYEASAAGFVYTYRFREALACIDRCLEIRSDDPVALYLRGVIREAEGSPEKAGPDYRAAVAAAPEYVPARRRLAEYLLYAQRPAEAAEHFQYLLTRTPGDQAAILGLARCQRALGETERALAALDELLGRAPDNVAALRERARLARDLNNGDDAARWYLRVIEHDPRDRAACYELGQLLLRTGKRQDARRWLDRAAQIDRDVERLRDLMTAAQRSPSDAEVRYQAGLLCLRNGQQEEGRRWLLGALRIDPGHGGARAALEGKLPPKARP